MGLRTGGFVAAYVAAYAASGRLAPWVERQFDLARLVARAAAGAAVLVLALFAFEALAGALARRRRDREVRTKRSALSLESRVAGALLGLLVGVATATTACWAYDVVRLGPWRERLPDVGASYTARFARALVREIVYAVVRQRGGTERRAATLSRLLSAPEQGLGELRSLFEHPALRALLLSRAFQEDLLSGERARVRANEDLGRVLADEALLERLAAIGLVPAHYRRPDYPDELAGELAALGARLRALQEDPEVQTLVGQLQSEGLLQPDGLLRLIRDRRFHRLLDRVLAPADPAVAPAASVGGAARCVDPGGARPRPCDPSVPRLDAGRRSHGGRVPQPA
jgi:hypothetical protein